MAQQDDLVALAVAEAGRKNLPPEMICAIIETESAWNTWAIRHEPDWRWWHRGAGGQIPYYRGASQATERMQQATSWGLMQVMGATARDLGCHEPFMSLLLDPLHGILYGTLYAAQQYRRFFLETGIEGVISSYNAGRPTERNQREYTEPVLLRMAAWKIKLESKELGS